MFTHASAEHFFTNMIVFVVLGYELERSYGGLRFMAILLLSVRHNGYFFSQHPRRLFYLFFYSSCKLQ
jgi:membrane associated rhomboid family serine protease